LFCLVADVKIRETTHNRKGLQDALHAIAASGSTIDTERPMKRVLEAGDQATGQQCWSICTTKNHPVSVDLNQLWVQLGVRPGSHEIELDSSAPLTSIRIAITTTRELRDSVVDVTFLVDSTPTPG
jgi:hypothetical protein